MEFVITIPYSNYIFAGIFNLFDAWKYHVYIKKKMQMWACLNGFRDKIENVLIGFSIYYSFLEKKNVIMVMLL